jgi:tetratricopeptide (TPR) repeat protein
MSAFFERVRAALAPKGYDVLRELASGGMGTVFLAHQRVLNRSVAIKIIRPELYTAQAAEQFAAEAETLATFSHPNIVPIHDADEADGMPYYVMAYLEGETVADRLLKGAMPAVDALKLGRDLLDALGAAHEHGVIHRDVKPSNVFLVAGRAVLVDFGIAKQRDTSVRVTVPGAVAGTVDYMPPEQARGEEVTERTDLYAAAMVSYEAFTGRHWFDAVRDGPRAVWQGLPRRIVRVLQRALRDQPADRWPTAAAFRRALWRTRTSRYRRRTLLLTLGGLAAGASGAVWLVHEKVEGAWPFRVPSALQVVITPLQGTCGAERRSGEHVAAALVRHLQGYVDFSARGPAAAPWFRPRSLVVVRGTVCARGDSLRVELEADVGRGGAADPGPIVARGDTDHVELLADTLAYGLVRQIWNRADPLGAELPRAALPQTPGGLAAWLEAERLLAEGRWGEADRAYDEAEAIDSTCWLCAWRHADVDKWLGRPFDRSRAARYMSHLALFPPHYQRLMRAAGQPFARRLETLTPLARERPDFLPAQFMLADELYHRGPLIGHSRDEAVAAFDRVVRLRPDFMPAWEHLVWVLTADGREARARDAFARLQQSGPARDPFSEELRALLQLGLACRFAGSVSCRRVLDQVLPAAGTYPDLAAGPRYLMSFDAPRGAVEFGRRFAALGDQPVLRQSGLVAEVAGYLALGLADSARAAARALRDRARSPTFDVFAPELDGALLLLDPDADPATVPARWADVRGALAAHVRSRASGDSTRRRAAWLLLLLGRRFPGELADSTGYQELVARERRQRPLARLLAATALQGRPDRAVAATDPLTELQADSLGDPAGADPFFRVVLHLFRAAWAAAARDPASAVRELAWYENNDVFERPNGPPQAADMDWAFGTLARWRTARLLDATGDRGEALCRAYAAVAAAWAAGDPPYRARADSAGRRLATLGCRGSA